MAPSSAFGESPTHVAIIMDGNGRWARRRGLPRVSGHQAGAERLKEIVKACPRLGVGYLTVFAFSTENWKRQIEEVDGLMRLFRRYIISESAELLQNGVRVQFIGEQKGMDAKLLELMRNLEERSRNNDAFHLTVAMNYGGRSEIVQAARKAAESAAAGEIRPDSITEESFSNLVYTGAVPDPDLVIRTSGEARLSNFLLWQCAYAELEFVDTLWPDFTSEQFESVLARYSSRERRFGAAAG